MSMIPKNHPCADCVSCTELTEENTKGLARFVKYNPNIIGSCTDPLAISAWVEKDKQTCSGNNYKKR